MPIIELSLFKSLSDRTFYPESLVLLRSNLRFYFEAFFGFFFAAVFLPDEFFFAPVFAFFEDLDVDLDLVEVFEESLEAGSEEGEGSGYLDRVLRRVEAIWTFGAIDFSSFW